MNDITNGLREEIERCEGIVKKAVYRLGDYLQEDRAALVVFIVAAADRLKEAKEALYLNDPERMAAALEILRGIKE